MARFYIEGLDDVIEQMKEMHQLTGEVADAMLMTGAEKSRQMWVAVAEGYPLRDSGDMIKSIKYAKNPKTVGDLRVIEVYPRGKDRKGKSNATKAFMVNYTEGEGFEWVAIVHEQENDFIASAMANVWFKFLETGNVPDIEYPKPVKETSGAKEKKSRSKSTRQKQWKPKGRNPYYYPQYQWMEKIYARR